MRVKHVQNSWDSKTVHTFSLALVVAELVKYCDFSFNNCCKAYVGPMLSPGDRNWQLIYPDYKRSGNVFATLQFLGNLQMSPLS
jgi:hypothetical protein